ncbi:MAG: hypothetical protein JWN56_2311 [Sphingobacteriales bacterium]|nr:hypothetical protein [Sphingobacteriales bacterium]
MIQQCIDVIKQKKHKVNYFEIGVQTGFCFFKIKADNKFAVDPNFTIKWTNKIRAYLKNKSNFNNKFFEVTSDDFFKQQASYIKKIGGIDVIFIDGLHLYEQVLLDIKNSLMFLNEGGVILVHDCNPLTEVAAVRAYTSDEVRLMNLPGWANLWNGDVWKAIVELRSTSDSLQVSVFNTDHGVGVIKKGKPERDFSLSDQQLKELSYQDLENHREEYLNLKDPSSFSDFVKELL